MNAEFFYSNLLMSLGFHYSGPPWVFLTAVIVLALVILGRYREKLGRMLTQRRLLEALLDFLKSCQRALKGL